MRASPDLSQRVILSLRYAGPCFVFLFSLSLPSVADHDPLLKIRASGFAPGSRSNARQAALNKAEVQAVEMAVDDLLGNDRWGVRNPLLGLAHKYRQSSRITSLEKTDGGVRVVAEVYIRNEVLRELAASLLLPLLRSPPRVIFLIAEEVVSETILSAGVPGFAEIDLLDGFQATGFSVIRNWRPTSHYSTSELTRKAMGSPTDAARVGRENDAEVILIGQAKTWIDEDKNTGAANRNALRRMAATLEVKVVRASDGAILDHLKADARVLTQDLRAGARLALTDAARKIRFKAMIAATFSVLGEPLVPPTTLTIHNPGDRSNLQPIVEELRRHGASSIEILASTAEIARLRFVYSGKFGPLVKGLESMEELPYRLEAREVFGHTMVFNAEFPSAPE